MESPTPPEGKAVPSDVKKYASQYKVLNKKYGQKQVDQWLGQLGMNKEKKPTVPEPAPAPDVTEAIPSDMMEGAMPDTYR